MVFVTLLWKINNVQLSKKNILKWIYNSPWPNGQIVLISFNHYYWLSLLYNNKWNEDRKILILWSIFLMTPSLQFTFQIRCSSNCLLMSLWMFDRLFSCLVFSLYLLWSLNKRYLSITMKWIEELDLICLLIWKWKICFRWFWCWSGVWMNWERIRELD